LLPICSPGRQQVHPLAELADAVRRAEAMELLQAVGLVDAGSSDQLKCHSLVQEAGRDVVQRSALEATAADVLLLLREAFMRPAFRLDASDYVSVPKFIGRATAFADYSVMQRRLPKAEASSFRLLSFYGLWGAAQ
jgi:hypothetical protein